MPRIFTVFLPLTLSLFIFVSCGNKQTVTTRPDGVLGAPEPHCHFVCNDEGNDDNKIVCQVCENNSTPFCAELDNSAAVVYCSTTLTSG